jgi:hypothetical protein
MLYIQPYGNRASRPTAGSGERVGNPVDPPA